jgi:hypothetical protein
MELVANVPLGPGDVPRGADDDAQFAKGAADAEAAGDHLYVGLLHPGPGDREHRLVQRPAHPRLCKPFVEGVLPCSGGQFDIQLSPDGEIGCPREGDGRPDEYLIAELARIPTMDCLRQGR